jgi:tetratricopeptide (TPR) repeat protein
MKLGIVLLLVFGFVAGRAVRAQAPPPQAQKSQPAQKQNPPAATQKPPAGANPFPEDTNNVPLMPSGTTPVAAEPPANDSRASLPGADVDPVRSPDDPQPDADTGAQGFSSSASGLDRVMPPPDTDIGHGKKGRAAAPEHQETAAEDEKVGAYYLDQKNWRAALSRYESAVVLDPENPEVYWGMAEAQRHLGKFAEAKASYSKLVEYDPDSKHGKEAIKILKSPELANAPTASATHP